jgi:hypothetical protein
LRRFYNFIFGFRLKKRKVVLYVAFLFLSNWQFSDGAGLGLRAISFSMRLGLGFRSLSGLFGQKAVEATKHPASPEKKGGTIVRGFIRFGRGDECPQFARLWFVLRAFSPRARLPEGAAMRDILHIASDLIR